MPDPMTDHPTAGARPDVDAIEERLELSRSPECQVAGDADDQLIVFDIPDLIAYIRTLEAERDAANPRSQGHFTRGTVPHQSQLPLLGDRAGDSKAENTAGIAR